MMKNQLLFSTTSGITRRTCFPILSVSMCTQRNVASHKDLNSTKKTSRIWLLLKG